MNDLKVSDCASKKKRRQELMRILQKMSCQQKRQATEKREEIKLDMPRNPQRKWLTFTAICFTSYKHGKMSFVLDNLVVTAIRSYSVILRGEFNKASNEFFSPKMSLCQICEGKKSVFFNYQCQNFSFYPCISIP